MPALSSSKKAEDMKSNPDDSTSHEDLFDYNSIQNQVPVDQEELNVIPEVHAATPALTIDLPIINMSNDSFENILITKLDIVIQEMEKIKSKQNEQASEIKKINNELKVMSTYLVDKKLINKSSTSINFYEKYDLTIPFNDMEKFKNFDET